MTGSWQRPRPACRAELRRCVASLAAALCMSAPAATLPAVHLTVIDDQLETRVAGVFVLFLASGSRAGNGHDSVSEPLAVVEGLSNGAGEVNLPPVAFEPNAFAEGGTFEGPDVVLLRRGYAVRVLRNVPHNHASVAAFTTLPFQGRTIKLHRVARLREQADAAHDASAQAAHAIANGGACGWQNFPRFLVAADRIAADWNLRAGGLPEDNPLHTRIAPRPLQELLARDRSYVMTGCASPRTFFEPYTQ